MNLEQYLTSPARHQAIQAAQIAIILRQLGKLKSYSRADLKTSLSIQCRRTGQSLELTDELLHEIRKRTGQMIALDHLAVPLDFSAQSRAA